MNKPYENANVWINTLHSGHNIYICQKPKKMNLQKEKEGIKMDSSSSDEDFAPIRLSKAKKRRLFVRHLLQRRAVLLLLTEELNCTYGWFRMYFRPSGTGYVQFSLSLVCQTTLGAERLFCLPPVLVLLLAENRHGHCNWLKHLFAVWSSEQWTLNLKIKGLLFFHSVMFTFRAKILVCSLKNISCTSDT